MVAVWLLYIFQVLVSNVWVVQRGLRNQMKRNLGLLILLIGLIFNCAPSLQSYQNPNKTYNINVCKKERPIYSNNELKSIISTTGIAFPTASSKLLETSFKKLDSIINQ